MNDSTSPEEYSGTNPSGGASDHGTRNTQQDLPFGPGDVGASRVVVDVLFSLTSPLPDNDLKYGVNSRFGETVEGLVDSRNQVSVRSTAVVSVGPGISSNFNRVRTLAKRSRTPC